MKILLGTISIGEAFTTSNRKIIIKYEIRGAFNKLYRFLSWPAEKA
jgi:hypothetical protein